MSNEEGSDFSYLKYQKKKLLKNLWRAKLPSMVIAISFYYYYWEQFRIGCAHKRKAAKSHKIIQLWNFLNYQIWDRKTQEALKIEAGIIHACAVATSDNILYEHFYYFVDQFGQWMESESVAEGRHRKRED